MNSDSDGALGGTHRNRQEEEGSWSWQMERGVEAKDEDKVQLHMVVVCSATEDSPSVVQHKKGVSVGVMGGRRWREEERRGKGVAICTFFLASCAVVKEKVLLLAQGNILVECTPTVPHYVIYFIYCVLWK